MFGTVRSVRGLVADSGSTVAVAPRLGHAVWVHRHVPNLTMPGTARSVRDPAADSYNIVAFAPYLGHVAWAHRHVPILWYHHRPVQHPL